MQSFQKRNQHKQYHNTDDSDDNSLVSHVPFRKECHAHSQCKKYAADFIKKYRTGLSEFGKTITKESMKFENVSKLFDHAAHNGSSCLNGHCFVSIMLCIPVKNHVHALYLSVPLGYRKGMSVDEDSLYVMEEIQKRIKVRDFINTSYDYCTGSHVGPDTIALFYMAKDRELGA